MQKAPLSLFPTPVQDYLADMLMATSSVCAGRPLPIFPPLPSQSGPRWKTKNGNKLLPSRRHGECNKITVGKLLQ